MGTTGKICKSDYILVNSHYHVWVKYARRKLKLFKNGLQIFKLTHVFKPLDYDLQDVITIWTIKTFFPC